MVICKICNHEFPTNLSLAHHIRQSHDGMKIYYDSYMKKINEGICKVCGRLTKFVKMSIGYRDYCSPSCANLAPAIKIKKEQTYFDKTGFTHNMHNPKSISKLRDTNFKKYGSETYLTSKEGVEKIRKFMDSDAFKISRVKKIKKTCIERYGVSNVFANEKVKEKIKETLLEKYGVSNPMKKENIVNKAKIAMAKSDAFKIDRLKKMKETYIHKNMERLIRKLPINYKIIKYDKEAHTLQCPTGHIFDIQEQMITIRLNMNVEICNVCNPYETYQESQKELYDFIKNNYDKKILVNARSIIKEYELDIYLPDVNLAFEFNGIYWHSELHIGNNYHFNKTKKCEESGIHLIHIYEDDWNYKQEIIKSRILNLLGKTRIKISARKTIIKEIVYSACEIFLTENHIQGNTISKVRLGLFYKNELVSVMTFGKSRFEDGIELIRFCNKLNTSVVGGANKLFTYYKNKYSPCKIISYADRSWTTRLNITLYDVLGFEFEKETAPNYYYVVKSEKKSRFGFRKSNLIKQGFDEDKSEADIMSERKIYRIYDSGSFKYTWS